MRVILAVTAAALASFASPAQDVRLSLDAPDERWRDVRPIADGVDGSGAASFASSTARIDVGPCPLSGDAPFVVRASLRTLDAGFSTPLMARRGGAVGASFVMGRRPGCVSFEVWSWARVRLVSRTRLDDGAWHRIEGVYDPATRSALLVIDGRVESWARVGPGGSPEAVLRLGNNIGADQPFPGDLDEVSVTREVAFADRFALVRPLLGSADRRAVELAALRARLVPPTTPALAPDEHADWPERRAAVRAAVRDGLGLDPWPERRELAPQVHGELRDDDGGFRVQRVSWATWPDYRATGWLWSPLEPAPAGTRRPAVLCPHGHWADGALHPVVQARARHFARSGYVALVVDSVHVEDVASGVNSIGAMTWNNVRALDWLASRADVDPARIGVTGASGGAQQTMYLLAIDDRPAAAAPICMISYFDAILDDTSAHCGCNHPPRVGLLTDEPEMCAVFAPKPILFGSVTGDWTRAFPKRALPELRGLWERQRRAAALRSLHLDAGHNYDRPFREAVYAFFAEHVGGGSAREATAEDPSLEPFERDALLALGPPPRVAPDRRRMARDYGDRRPRVDSLGALAPGLPWQVEPAEFVAVDDDGQAASSTTWRHAVVRGPDGVGIPVASRLGAEAAAAAVDVVVVPDDGIGPLLLAPPEWLDRVARVHVVEPRFRGSWRPFASAWRRNGLLLGRGEGYEAAHDIARVVESLPGERPVVLVGIGTAGVEVLIAAHLTRRAATVVTTDVGPLFADDGNREPHCPELLRFGDLPALAGRIPGPRRVVLGGAPGGVAFPSLAAGTKVVATPRVLVGPGIARELR